jgi:hypothetical protein
VTAGARAATPEAFNNLLKVLRVLLDDAVHLRLCFGAKPV